MRKIGKLILMSLVILDIAMTGSGFYLMKVHAAQQDNSVKPEYGPQVAFYVDHSANGHVWIVPKAVVWYNVGPLNKELHLTSPPDKSIMICRQYTLVVDNASYIGLKCGADDYVLYGTGLKPKD